MDEKISVIVPVYNVEKYLPKCIESIIHQTYANLEIILVDDGSVDHCGKICDEYAEKDDRIKVIHKENGGLSDARNVGINEAAGDYLMFVDSDDYIASEMVECLYKRILSDASDIAICNFIYVDEEGHPIPSLNDKMPIQDEVITGRDALCYMAQSKKPWYYVVAWNRLYKKSVVRTIRFPFQKYHEDEFVAHYLWNECSRVSCVSEALYYYVQRKTSIMGQQYSAKRLDAVEGLLDRTAFFFREKMEHFAIQYFLRSIATLSIGIRNKSQDPINIKRRLKELQGELSAIYRNNFGAIVKNASFKQFIGISLFSINITLGEAVMKIRRI